MSNDEIAARKGFLQKRDPRFKVFCGAILLVAVLLSHSTVELALIYLAVVFIAALSGIRLDYFLKRTLLFIPVFSLFIVLPAVLNVVTPGVSVLSFQLFGHGLAVTRQGIDSAAIFLMRVLASVSLSVLLVLTTRHHTLLKTLRIFKVPQMFVMTLGMCYRYIHLFLDVLLNTFLAIKSRVGFVSSGKTGRRIVGTGMAGMWLRSYRLHTQVYSAMLSRGYSGEPRIQPDFKTDNPDFIMIGTALLLLTGTLWLNRFIH